MDEILKKLFEAEILSEETKTELETAYKNKLEESVKQARQDAYAEVTATLNEQWINEREALIDALDAKITESMTEEMTELKESIERFRDLEAEYAQKLVEAKEQMSETLQADIETLIEQLDQFVEISLTAEIKELKEDIIEVRKNQKGRKVFEAFMDEFKEFYTEDKEIFSKLDETEKRLEDTLVALEKSERRTAQLIRAKKLDEVLSPLSGRSREVMEAILKSVDTNMLEEAYQTYVGRVLKEASEASTKTSEKETKVLAEGESKREISGVLKSGDDFDQVIREQHIDNAERKSLNSISETEKARLRAMAGLQ